MVLAADILSLLALLIIAYQDFRERAISWWALPVVFIAQGIAGFERAGGDVFFTGLVLNIVFLFAQFIMLSVYFSIRSGRPVNIIDNQIGLGDILFFVAASSAFSFLNFFAWYLASLACALIGFLAYRLIIKTAESRIPLAGIASLVLVPVLIINLSSTRLGLHDDSLLAEYISKWKI